LIESAEERATLDPRSASVGIHSHGPERREIDQQTAVRDGTPDDAMAATANPDVQPAGATEAHGLGHVGSARAAGDNRGPAVDHSVP
jgi:hypothetical protein